MLRVGLTGGIACGKTVVRKLLAERGAFTLDADTLVHELLGPGTPLSRRVGEEFGEGHLLPDGSVDRKKLGALVFADSEARQRLNALVHPEVVARIGQLLDGAERRGERLAIVDAALMIETGSYRGYDRIIVVHCPRSLQIRRLVERDGLTREEAERRVAAQMPVEDKKRFAHYLIDTAGTLEQTKKQVQAVWEQLRVEAD
jgi:dephospho-CoA kinase